MKIPYITIHKLRIGFGIYDTKVKGCVLWCDKLKNFIKQIKKS